jgi:lipopolysaccharide export system permease protein
MQKDEQTADIRGIGAGKFTEYSQGDLVFYVEKITEDNKMHQVFVQHREHGKLAIINAQAGRIEDLADGRYMILERGERVEGQPGALNYNIENFAEYAVRLDEKTAAANLDREAAAVHLLWNSEDVKDIAELQRRFSIPLGIIFLTLLALPLAQISPRGGVYGNISVAFLIYFSYGNLVRVSQSWVMKETLPAWLGGSWLYVVLLIVGGILLANLYGWRWVMMKIREKVAR